MSVPEWVTEIKPECIETFEEKYLISVKSLFENARTLDKRYYEGIYLSSLMGLDVDKSFLNPGPSKIGKYVLKAYWTGWQDALTFKEAEG